MQVICYMFMMLCKLCSHMLCVYDVMQVIQDIWETLIYYDTIICKFGVWLYASSYMICYGSLVYDYMQVHLWYVCKFGVWLYASSHMTCYASLVFDYMQVTCASLHLCMICIHMQVNPFVCHTYICKFTPLYDINNLCKLTSLWHMWFMQVWVDYLC